MDNVPQPKMEIPNHQNYQPDMEMFRLRKRLNDMLRLGAMTPETYQQTIMQVWQEGERRRTACLQEAEDHLRKYHGCVAEANAWAAQSSVLYAVINGFVGLEEKRNQELARQAQERAQVQAEAEALAARQKAEEEAAAAKRAEELAEAARQEEARAIRAVTKAPKSSGGRRKKP